MFRASRRTTTAEPSDRRRRTSARKAASFLVADLLSPLGRAADEARGRPSSLGTAETGVSVFGQAVVRLAPAALLTRAARGSGARS